MNEPTPILPTVESPAGPQPDSVTRVLFPGGWPQRLWFAWATCLVPAISFGTAIAGMHLADWQKPGSEVWLELLVDRPGALAFFPLAGVLMLLGAAIAARPGSWVFSPYCRAALVVGLVLAVHYAFLLPAAIAVDSPWPEVIGAWQEWGAVLLAISGITLAWLGGWALLRYLHRRFGWWAPVGVATLLWLGAGLYSWSPWVEGTSRSADAMFLSPLLWIFIFSLFAGPIWTAEALGRLLYRLRGLGTAPHYSLIGLVVGFGAYAVSWRMALLQVVEAYEKLPPEPPNCFVATAAARAPLWLTRGFAAEAGGASFRATPQLQRFKLFEIALRVASPPAHQALRRSYDRFGPMLAGRLDSPGRAALAWLALKPLEGLALLLLLLAGGARLPAQAALLYRRSTTAR